MMTCRYPFPPGAVWVLVESSTIDQFPLTSGPGGAVQRLQTGRWHILPAEWKAAVDAAVLRGEGAYSQYRIKTFIGD
jgi:hypothetical protein